MANNNITNIISSVNETTVERSTSYSGSTIITQGGGSTTRINPLFGEVSDSNLSNTLGSPISQLTTAGFQSGNLTTVGVSSFGGASIFPVNTPDIRVRIRAQDTQKHKIYGPRLSHNILSVLYNSDGVVFPYTPTISQSFTAEYRQADLVHSNYDIMTYTKTPSPTISVSGRFTVQNIDDAVYVLAMIHFFRTVTKMHFGQSDQLAGMPPPILLFRGYGQYMFNDVKVLVKSFSTSFDDSIDYVTLNINGNQARVPVLLTANIDLAVVQTPTAMRQQFNLDQFRTGALMSRKPGWI